MQFLAQSGEARTLTGDLTSIMRQQRHTGTRVMISTQEPTLDPKLLDLANATFVHRFLSPAWYQVLKKHLAGAHAASRAAASSSTESNPDGSSGNSLFDTIVRLRTGEALVFSPTAYLSVEDRGVDGDGEDTKAARPLGDGVAKMRVRRRVTADGGRSITADQVTAGELDSSHDADASEVPMYVVERQAAGASQAAARQKRRAKGMPRFETNSSGLGPAGPPRPLDPDAEKLFLRIKPALENVIRQRMGGGVFLYKDTGKNNVITKVFADAAVAVGMPKNTITDSSVLYGHCLPVYQRTVVSCALPSSHLPHRVTGCF